MTDIVERLQRDEVRDAVEVILTLHDHQTTKLSLALEQLDRAADEIERLRNIATLNQDGPWRALEEENERLRVHIRDLEALIARRDTP